MSNDERMNDSKPCGPSGDQQTSGEVLTRLALRASPSPSPQPSPPSAVLLRPAACRIPTGVRSTGPCSTGLLRRTGPPGRGRILLWFTAQPSAVSARRTSRTTEPAAGCSLSPWERVRVRGTGLPFDIATRTLPEIVELRESSGRAGGFP